MQVRSATPTDLERCAEIEYLAPSPEVLAFMPSIEGARRLTLALLRRSSEVLVADDGGVVVGFAQTSTTSEGMLAFAPDAIRAFGVLGAARLVLQGWPRQRVDFARPEGVMLQELHVDPARRGQGVGGLLLGAVVERHGHGPISLTTRTDNPARRLYERHGFETVAEKRHPTFERRTGSMGRVLMVRPGSVRSS